MKLDLTMISLTCDNKDVVVNESGQYNNYMINSVFYASLK